MPLKRIGRRTDNSSTYLENGRNQTSHGTPFLSFLHQRRQHSTWIIRLQRDSTKPPSNVISSALPFPHRRYESTHSSEKRKLWDAPSIALIWGRAEEPIRRFRSANSIPAALCSKWSRRRIRVSNWIDPLCRRMRTEDP